MLEFLTQIIIFALHLDNYGLFPPPLSQEDEAKYIGLLKINDKKAKDKLVNHNLRLVAHIIKKFNVNDYENEELISVGTLGLIKAINSFDSDKGVKLATYASKCIENEILMHIRKNASHRGDVSIDEPLNTDWDGNELLLSDVLGTEENSVSENIEKSEEERVVREAVRELCDREREIIELRYGLGGKREMTQKEVADKLGISQSYISRLEKKIIGRL